VFKIGITGQSGFIGTHLVNKIRYDSGHELVEFHDSYFSDMEQLGDFVASCDIIIHLAAINRHPDPEYLYSMNKILAGKLMDVCDKMNAKPHIIYSSSIQENLDNAYGKAKYEIRKEFEDWSTNRGNSFTALLIPNVYGPFCKPFYNSVVATFCYQLANQVECKVLDDVELNLIFVSELVNFIVELIKNEKNAPLDEKIVQSICVPGSRTIYVSELLNKINQISFDYLKFGSYPKFGDSFTINLFNTFLTYVNIDKFFPFMLRSNTDSRGAFTELMRLESGGQVSFSSTVPGVTRGEHFHTRKIERFMVLSGKARVQLRKIGTEFVQSFEVDGRQPAFIDMPVWFTHNITNIGEDPLLTLFWINEPFDPENSDTFFEKVNNKQE